MAIGSGENCLGAQRVVVSHGNFGEADNSPSVKLPRCNSVDHCQLRQNNQDVNEDVLKKTPSMRGHPHGSFKSCCLGLPRVPHLLWCSTVKELREEAQLTQHHQFCTSEVSLMATVASRNLS